MVRTGHFGLKRTSVAILDIYASLKEPLEVHNVAALKWWLLCQGVQVPSSCKKPDLIEVGPVVTTSKPYISICYFSVVLHYYIK